MVRKTGKKYVGIKREEVEAHLHEKIRSWNPPLKILSRGVGRFYPMGARAVYGNRQDVAYLQPVDPDTFKPLGHYEWQAETAQSDSGQLVVTELFYRGKELTRKEALEALAEIFTRREKYPRRVRVPYEYVPDREILDIMRQDKFGKTCNVA